MVMFDNVTLVNPPADIVHAWGFDATTDEDYKEAIAIRLSEFADAMVEGMKMWHALDAFPNNHEDTHEFVKLLVTISEACKGMSESIMLSIAVRTGIIVKYESNGKVMYAPTEFIDALAIARDAAKDRHPTSIKSPGNYL